MSSKSSKADNLEKQVAAGIEAGMISLDDSQPAKKSRGRPKTKSVEPPARPMLTPEESKMENEKKLQSILSGAQKRKLICQLKAFCVYFPEITRDAVNAFSFEELTIDQLQRLLTSFEDSVLGASEVTSIPLTLKKLLGKVETTAVGIGTANYKHPVLGELIKMEGLSKKIAEDPDIDTNVKLISVKLAGKLPRNPYMNIVTGIVRVAWDLYLESGIMTVKVDADSKYSKLNKK